MMFFEGISLVDSNISDIFQKHPISFWNAFFFVAKFSCIIILTIITILFCLIILYVCCVNLKIMFSDSVTSEDEYYDEDENEMVHLGIVQRDL